MSKLLLPDMHDDEIRVISSIKPDNLPAPIKPRRRRGCLIISLVAVGVIALSVILYFILYPTVDDGERVEHLPETVSAATSSVQSSLEDDALRTESYVEINDTTVNDMKFTILTPRNATPCLSVGDDVLNDSIPVLAVQAAYVRQDNGKIVGAYVLNGELLSKGQAKAGYCAIIDNKISIGVAESTPLLEEALESDGYFFRQYPLVVANQIVENKPKGKSQRKALAELNGNMVVILSHDRMSFHDFSQSLVDLGVSNAIYLTGSTAYGFAKDRNGNVLTFGKKVSDPSPSVNYIYWK